MTIVIVHGPKASGKTRYAKELMVHFGCKFVADDGFTFNRRQKFKPYTLVLTNEEPPFELNNARVVSIDEALRAIGKNRVSGGRHA